MVSSAIIYLVRNTQTNQRCGRGVQICIDGSKYEGYWQNDRANIRGKLYHNDGDIYNGNNLIITIYHNR